ncbi:flagellar assembly protein FliH [Archangium sp.]|uniref:flagellar assembly protein FliH n=1 Tax=Archangium sp. TaxID=1872627 RepID=UPI002D3E4E28|nr:flagellar assembly protein FliH [Archangium sp.]HYO59279.1 flagellar assembly protein FliH [Archangium sp.]
MPPYRLQALLEIRERAKAEAEQAFSDAVKALEKQKAELKRLEQELEQRKAERKQKVMAYLQQVMAKGTAGPNGFTMMNRYEGRLKDEEAQLALEIERQKEAVAAAEKLVEQRRREMAEAARELKAIEKHKENWQKQLRAERQAKEELNQEEIGNTLFLMRQRK